MYKFFNSELFEYLKVLEGEMRISYQFIEKTLNNNDKIDRKKTFGNFVSYFSEIKEFAAFSQAILQNNLINIRNSIAHNDEQKSKIFSYEEVIQLREKIMGTLTKLLLATKKIKRENNIDYSKDEIFEGSITNVGEQTKNKHKYYTYVIDNTILARSKMKYILGRYMIEGRYVIMNGEKVFEIKEIRKIKNKI